MRGNFEEPPTGLIPWFSKTEGNTYATLLHHPFLFKGKTNASSRRSRQRTLVDRKRKRLVNAVDVVEHLRDPTNPSTEHTTPLRSAHVQLGDIPCALDPVEAEEEFR